MIFTATFYRKPKPSIYFPFSFSCEKVFILHAYCFRKSGFFLKLLLWKKIEAFSRSQKFLLIKIGYTRFKNILIGNCWPALLLEASWLFIGEEFAV